MLVQRFAEPPDRVLNSLENRTARKIRLALRNDVVPKCVADSFVQRPIADDGKAPRLRRDQNQRGVARARAGASPSCPNSRFCPRERVDARVGNDANRDAAGRALFGVGNGASDGGALSCVSRAEIHDRRLFGTGLRLEVRLFVEATAEHAGDEDRRNRVALVLNARAASLYFRRSNAMRFSVPPSWA